MTSKILIQVKGAFREQGMHFFCIKGQKSLGGKCWSISLIIEIMTLTEGV